LLSNVHPSAFLHRKVVSRSESVIDLSLADVTLARLSPVATGLDKISFGGSPMLDRREMMKRAGTAALGAAAGLTSVRAFALDTVTLPFDNGERPLVKYPQKRPMIGLTSRPPQLETPFSIFNDGAITPNNAFFVRYHLADVPLGIDPDKSRARSTGPSNYR
jgi:hypothetical protein